MTRRWFGTDGIRGRAGEAPLLPGFLHRLGRALGEQACSGAGQVLIARDTRASGPSIAADLGCGLVAAGARVVDLGVLPTAGLPLALRARDAELGVVVSASHNPWRDNGIKVFGRDGLKLSDEREAALEDRVVALGGADPAVDAPDGGDRPVELPVEDGAAAYEATLRERFAGLDLSGLRLAVDCAHGAASATAPAVLSGLGAEVDVRAAAPDGRNINAGCGSTHLDHVAAAVRQGGHDLGMAFDGDADRVLLVDGAGRPCTGDHMLGFLALRQHAAGRLRHDTVVGTVMTNLGLQQRLARDGVRLHRTPVGDRHVLAAMMERGLDLGGEASGHLLFHERADVPGPRLLGAREHWIGDGLYTALRVLAELVATGRDVASLVDDVPAVPQVLLNVPVASRPPVESLPELQAAVGEAARRWGEQVRIVLRYSGTEDLARVMVEGSDAGVVDELSRRLAEIWRRAIAARAR